MLGGRWKITIYVGRCHCQGRSLTNQRCMCQCCQTMSGTGEWTHECASGTTETRWWSDTSNTIRSGPQEWGECRCCSEVQLGGKTPPSTSVIATMSILTDTSRHHQRLTLLWHFVGRNMTRTDQTFYIRELRMDMSRHSMTKIHPNILFLGFPYRVTKVYLFQYIWIKGECVCRADKKNWSVQWKMCWLIKVFSEISTWALCRHINSATGRPPHVDSICGRGK